jgi:hypothetical protein
MYEAKRRGRNRVVLARRHAFPGDVHSDLPLIGDASQGDFAR